jgi:hypothetical protein
MSLDSLLFSLYTFAFCLRTGVPVPYTSHRPIDLSSYQPIDFFLYTLIFIFAFILLTFDFLYAIFIAVR